MRAGGASAEKANPVRPSLQLGRRRNRSDAKGRVAEGAGGVCVPGTYEEDGPLTWEALMSPCEGRGPRGAGQQSPTSLRFAGACRDSAKKKALAAR